MSMLLAIFMLAIVTGCSPVCLLVIVDGLCSFKDSSVFGELDFVFWLLMSVVSVFAYYTIFRAGPGRRCPSVCRLVSVLGAVGLFSSFSARFAGVSVGGSLEGVFPDFLGDVSSGWLLFYFDCFFPVG